MSNWTKLGIRFIPTCGRGRAKKGEREVALLGAEGKADNWSVGCLCIRRRAAPSAHFSTYSPCSSCRPRRGGVFPGGLTTAYLPTTRIQSMGGGTSPTRITTGPTLMPWSASWCRSCALTLMTPRPRCGEQHFGFFPFQVLFHSLLAGVAVFKCISYFVSAPLACLLAVG